MPAWATVTITLGASLIAVAGTLLNGWLGERWALARRDAESQARRIREGAKASGRIEILRRLEVAVSNSLSSFRVAASRGDRSAWEGRRDSLESAGGPHRILASVEENNSQERRLGRLVLQQCRDDEVDHDPNKPDHRWNHRPGDIVADLGGKG